MVIHLIFGLNVKTPYNEWTSKELFNFFRFLQIENRLSTQLEAGHILFKKNNQTDEIIKLFHKVLDYDEELITDYYNDTNQISRFRECRHDQGIWSLLTKIYDWNYFGK